MSRLYNFSAGPAALPDAVLEHARYELLDWSGSGQSVMEMSHRGKHFLAIAAQAEEDLRDLLDVPDNYKVLFLQGGATTQFAMVPLNLLRGERGADYVDTGSWSRKAIGEAKHFTAVNVVASSKSTGDSGIPAEATWSCDPSASYLHFTPNETIGGVEFHWLPSVGDVPLVADMSSTLLSRPIDIERYGLIYAGAQKNIGPAGLTVVIVREDLLGSAQPRTPSMLDYSVHAKSESMYNTPPTFAWYIAGLVFAWIRDGGGLQAMEKVNARKAAKLYGAIDGSDFYCNPVEKPSRSWMNIPFTLAEPSLDGAFLNEAASVGLLNLKGHRSVGGMRASIYNAMPESGVDALIEFMGEFERHRA